MGNVSRAGGGGDNVCAVVIWPTWQSQRGLMRSHGMLAMPATPHSSGTWQMARSSLPKPSHDFSPHRSLWQTALTLRQHPRLKAFAPAVNAPCSKTAEKSFLQRSEHQHFEMGHNVQDWKYVASPRPLVAHDGSRMVTMGKRSGNQQVDEILWRGWSLDRRATV